MIPTARAIATEQKQAFEAGPGLSSNAYILVKNENVQSLLPWVIPSYKRSWMQRCLIRNQLVKLYEILKYHILLLIERSGGFLKKVACS